MTEIILPGGGEMGALIRAFDWSKTPLGPLESWPQSLRTTTNLLLRSPVPIVLLWGPEGIMIYNDAYSGFAGGRHPSLLGSEVRKGWPEVADFNDNVMKVGLAGGTLAYRDQKLFLERSGHPEPVWMNLDYSPVLDETGTPAGVIAIVVETTERVLAEQRLRESEEHLRLVVHELNHRVKNNLAMTQAIAMQTFRSPSELAESQQRFAARMVALGQATDLLTGERGGLAAIRAVVNEAALPHAPEGRLTIQGPNVNMSPKSALALTLAMHELATNAVKYGAWSNDTGVVAVSWTAASSADGARLRLEWKEMGGPRVQPPQRRGFGSRLIERGLSGELGGTVKMDFAPAGLVCTVEATLARADA